ncbi:hypothetical protein [Massilia sp. METH4]|uniref:hypothetical protein n=1 Tax=Massilia sp. METH4 TaxID=3123041 RepID=UPI0030CEF5B3
MNAPADPPDTARQPPGQPPLRLRSTIDAPTLERVRIGLEAVLFARMHGARPRTATTDEPADTAEAMARGNMPPSKILVFLRRCGLLGLMVALAFTASGGLEWDGYRLDLILASYFIAGLALSLLLPRIAAGARAWRPERWTWPRKTLARRLAARALERSRAMAPFVAQYDIDDAIVTYTRIKGDDSRVEWTRPLAGWYAQGDGFTVLFEDTASLKSVVILHERSARFDELLALHGLRPLASA